MAFFLYKRKKSRWITVQTNIDSLIATPVNYNEAYLKRKVETMKLEEMALQPKPNSTKKLIGFRILSVLGLALCAFVLITEATVIINPKYTLLYFIVEENQS